MKKLFFIVLLPLIVFSCSTSSDLIDDMEDNLVIDSVLNNNNNRQNFSNLTFSILGNSISTYMGYLPYGYKVYYNEKRLKVEETWWMVFSQVTGYKMNKNASWSGSTVTNNSNNKDSYFTSDKRLSDLAGKTIPDMIFILGGTNDWHSSSCPLGSYPTDETFNKKTFRGAYSYLVHQLQLLYPHTIVFCCSILPRKDCSNTNKGINGWSIAEGNESIKSIANNYGAYYVDLTHCGLDADFDKYTIDGIHPNAKGMRLIANDLYIQINKLIKQNNLFAQ